LNFFLPFIDLKNLFFKSDGGLATSRQEKHHGCQKHRAVSRHEKMAFSTPSRLVVLELPSPSPKVCTGVRTYADVTTKISRIDRLPNLLSNGAPLAR